MTLTARVKAQQHKPQSQWNRYHPFTVTVGGDRDDKRRKATLAAHSDAWLTAANGHRPELIATQNHKKKQRPVCFSQSHVSLYHVIVAQLE